MNPPNGIINRYPYCPVPYGRRTFGDLADIMLPGEKGGAAMYEFGSTRNELNMKDGNSTPFLAWLAHVTMKPFVSIDINPETRIIANNICEHYLPTCQPAFTQDAIIAAQRIREPLSLIYLDAWDYSGDLQLSVDKHLELFKLCEPHLEPHALVMIDDVLNLDNYEGKGRLVIPYLLEKGYTFLAKDYCCLLQKPE